jgi:hypothetical protein
MFFFFNCVPRIKFINGRRVHVFKCAAFHCKARNGHDMRRFLDTGERKLISGSSLAHEDLLG